MENNSDFGKFTGEVLTHLSFLKDNVVEIRADVKELRSFQAATEERLRSGSTRFMDHEDRIRKAERFPWGRVGAIAVGGFMIMTAVLALVIR